MLRTPSDVGIPYEPLSISHSPEPNLSGWFLPARGKARGTVLFLHGNAENISTHFANVYWLPEHGYQVFLFDYAGYGESQGSPSGDGIHTDVARMVRYVIANSRVTSTPLFLMGQSLGATMALYTASLPQFKDTFRGVIADSPFSSYRRIAREKLGLLWLTYILQWPLGFLVYDGYSPERTVSKIEIPVLLIHGLQDETVPPHHSRRLCELMGSRCERIEVPGVEHGKTLGQADIRAKIVLFFERTASATPFCIESSDQPLKTFSCTVDK